MSILTAKQRQYRDELAAADSNCKAWFPFDEGSGTIITDVIGGVVETDASAAHAEASAISFGKAAGVSTSGSFPELKPNFLLVISQKVVTAESFVIFTLGNIIKANVTNGIASCDYGAGANNNATTSASSIGASAGDILTTACAVIGNTIYHYESTNGAGISANNSADASNFVAAFSAGNPTLDAYSTISSTTFRQHVYGAAFFTFNEDEFTSAEIVAALDEIDKNWPAGRKQLPATIL